MFVVSGNCPEVTVTFNLALHANVMKEFSASSFHIINDKVNRPQRPYSFKHCSVTILCRGEKNTWVSHRPFLLVATTSV